MPLTFVFWNLNAVLYFWLSRLDTPLDVLTVFWRGRESVSYDAVYDIVLPES